MGYNLNRPTFPPDPLWPVLTGDYSPRDFCWPGVFICRTRPLLLCSYLSTCQRPDMGNSSLVPRRRWIQLLFSNY